MDTTTETGLVLPTGVNVPPRQPGVLPLGPQQGMIVNETDLPDAVVAGAIETYFEEHASMLGVNQGGASFSTYANRDGSLLARSKFRTPRNVIDEIILARDLAERDDDVGSAMGAMLALAFGEGMRHSHEDETTIALFDEIASHCNLDLTLMEMYRELLISSQVTTVHLFTRENFPIKPQGADRQRTRSIIAPLIGVIPAELIRILDDDMFNTGTLAYKPANGGQERWLKEFFGDRTSPARKAEMRRENPVLASLLVRPERLDEDVASLSSEAQYDPVIGNEVYVLNPRMVSRMGFPKGSWKYPRPLMTRNFALLEAKRLLNIMDYALLQGGSNFLVVAKKGSDARPALPEEVTNLRETIRRASTTGVIVGDHRLSIEIITPDLTELLNASKRNLLGRKIAMALLRLPGFTVPEAGAGQAVLTDTEIIARVISSDRRLIRRHLESKVYGEVVTRNSSQFAQGAAGIWFPKIVLQGLQYFTDLVLKLRDRGDISRQSAVAAGGFDYQSEVQQRKREKPDDRIMVPAEVPFSKPGQPSDNGGGRPVGGSQANGAPGSQPSRSTQDPARPARVIQRNAGETVKAVFDEETGATYRVGEVTERVLEEYASAAPGRITPFERRALEQIDSGDFAPFREGPLSVVPVNGDYSIADVRVIRLAEGLSVMVGENEQDALVTRALVFREPEFNPLEAQETALRWGFDCEVPELVEPPA